MAAAPERYDYEGDGGSDFHDGTQQVQDDLENFSDEPEEAEEYDDQQPDWYESTNTSRHPNLSTTTLRTSSLNPPAFPSDPPEEFPTSPPKTTIRVLEPKDPASLDLGLHDSISLRIDSEKTVTVQRVDDLTQLTQREDEHNSIPAVVPDYPSEHAPASSMSAEQRIKQLEVKVAKLNLLRSADAASISRSSYPLQDSLSMLNNLI